MMHRESEKPAENVNLPAPGFGVCYNENPKHNDARHRHTEAADTNT